SYQMTFLSSPVRHSVRRRRPEGAVPCPFATGRPARSGRPRTAQRQAAAARDLGSRTGLRRFGGEERLMTVTSHLVEYVRTARLEDVPEDVRHEAKRALLNIVGCALGGA